MKENLLLKRSFFGEVNWGVRVLLILFAFHFSLFTSAQEPQAPAQSEYIPVWQYWQEHDIFQHLDLSVTGGTTGLGIEVSSPIGKYFQLRAGYELMPRFTAKMKFDVTLGGESAVGSAKFAKMQKMMYGFSGYEVDDHVDMVGKPTMNNLKVLLDFFPFKKKNWHFTAGFYWGPSKFAEAENTTEAMTSLLSVGIYNRMYENACNNYPLFDWDAMGIPEEIQDKYHLNLIPVDLYDQIKSYGRLGFGLGTFTHDVTDNKGVVHHTGEKYYMEPGTDGMVRVKAYSNAFKPYVGFGYGGNMVKGRDDWKISFDAGVWFWGGTPSLYTHDGINLTKDVENIGGQVGDYVDVFKAFKVYPVIGFRITKRLF